MVNPFHYFDKICCINLKERNDRFQAMKIFFKKYDIPATIYRMNRNPNGMVGCFESHVQVIYDAYHKGANNVLVFEDDIHCTVSKEQLHSIVSECLPYLNKFAYFQFGYVIMPHQLLDFVMCPRYTTNIALFAGNCTHAYCLNREGMLRVLSTYQKGLHNTQIDIYYLDVFRYNKACCIPMLFDQNFCMHNDNDKPTTFYYSALRAISCHTSKNAYMFWSSLIKYYYIHIAVITLCIVLLYKLWIHLK